METIWLRIVQEWLDETYEELGIEPGEEEQPVNILDIHRKIPLQTFGTLHRCYVIGLQVLRLLVRGRK